MGAVTALVPIAFAFAWYKMPSTPSYKIRNDVSLYKLFQDYQKSDNKTYFEEMEKKCAEAMGQHQLPATANVSLVGVKETDLLYPLLMPINNKGFDRVFDFITFNRENTRQKSIEIPLNAYSKTRQDYLKDSKKDIDEVVSLMKPYEPLLYFHCMYSINERNNNLSFSPSDNTSSEYKNNQQRLGLQYVCAEKHLDYFDIEHPTPSVYNDITIAYESSKWYRKWLPILRIPFVYKWFYQDDFYNLKMKYRYVKYSKVSAKVGRMVNSWNPTPASAPEVDE